MAHIEELPQGNPAPEVLEDRIWVDGCWDFFHHGHAGAMLQARQLGNELYVGIHSDEAILENKGPTVMTLQERNAAVDACRWVTKYVPYAPYVTSLPWITHYGCKYVVHGDDITSDSSGEDCYRFVKAAGRFKVVKRTPSISTTDLVGRMLLCTKTHFIKSLPNVLEGQEGSGSDAERKATGDAMKLRIEQYATDETGLNPGAAVWFWSDNSGFSPFLRGTGPRPGQRIVYVDGGFDLFSSGHIEFLRRVNEEEAKLGHEGGSFVVAGVHDDSVINEWKGVNYPIMNIFERGLCVLQCKYVNAVVFGAPFVPDQAYLQSSPYGTPAAVYHGPTSFMPTSQDPYAAAKELGIYKEIGSHKFSDVNAGTIVQRIMKSRDMYEERQRAKGVKAVGEEAQRRRELLEEEQRLKESQRK